MRIVRSALVVLAGAVFAVAFAGPVREARAGGNVYTSDFVIQEISEGKITALMQADVNPGTNITLNADVVKGQYIVIHVKDGSAMCSHRMDIKTEGPGLWPGGSYFYLEMSTLAGYCPVAGPYYSPIIDWFDQYKSWFSNQRQTAGDLVDPRVVYDDAAVTLVTSRAQAKSKIVPQGPELMRKGPLKRLP